MSTSTSPVAASCSNVSTVASIMVMASSQALEHDGRAVPQAREPPEEQRTLRHQHRAVQVPRRHPRQRVRKPRNGARDVALRRREPGHAALAREGRDVALVELVAHDPEAGEHPVVAVGDVAAALRLGDLRVVDLGRVDADVADRDAEGVERIADERRQLRLWRRAGADRHRARSRRRARPARSSRRPAP
jgi:hypothetical protein